VAGVAQQPGWGWVRRFLFGAAADVDRAAFARVRLLLLVASGSAAVVLVSVAAGDYPPFSWRGVATALATLVAIIVALRTCVAAGMAVAAVGGASFAISTGLAWYEGVTVTAVWMIAVALAGYAAAAAHDRRRDVETERDDLLQTMLEGERLQRLALASDLHDDTIQVMAAVLLQLDGAARSGNHGVVRAADTLREALERTRRMMFELNPPLLAERGLAAAIGELAETTRREMECLVGCDVTDDRFSVATEELVYRTAREALTNVRKHSRAQRVQITVDHDCHTITATVTDNGVGFDPSAARRQGHIGLDSTAERIRLAGGTFTVRSHPAHGTSINITLPAMTRSDGWIEPERFTPARRVPA
jgi:signal transduction histidine kinase